MHGVRALTTAELSAAELDACRRLMDAAFDDFTDDDWTHALGGWHAVVWFDGGVIAHAAIVPRAIVVGARSYRAGYVEAVAVRPHLQGTGLGTRVMTTIGDLAQTHFELAVLSTGEWHFYERLGWERWRGPAFVRRNNGDLARVEDEDDGLMVLRCSASADLDLASPIACDERDGDSW